MDEATSNEMNRQVGCNWHLLFPAALVSQEAVAYSSTRGSAGVGCVREHKRERDGHCEGVGSCRMQCLDTRVWPGGVLANPRWDAGRSGGH